MMLRMKKQRQYSGDPLKYSGDLGASNHRNNFSEQERENCNGLTKRLPSYLNLHRGSLCV